MFDHLDDASPPTPSPQQHQAVRLRLARYRRRRRLAASSVLVTVAAVATIVAVNLFNGPRDTAVTVDPTVPSGSSTPDGATSTFATVKVSGNSQVEIVQIRALVDGRILRTLSIRTDSFVDVTPGLHGLLLVAVMNNDCRTTLESLDGATGAIKVLRYINRTVIEMAPSPDGRYLAYVTSPVCAAQESAGMGVTSPGVLAMLNLATGSTTTLGQAGVPKAPLDDQGSYSDPSWSPNSRQIVVDYQTDWNKLLVIPVAHLTRSSSTKIHSPEGCSYSAPLWTDTGILAAEACGRSPSSRTSPSELVEVSATGTARRTWALPACTAGFRLQGRQTGPVVVNTYIGYGNGACSGHQIDRLSELTPTGLRTIINLPER
jgi:hypothetical protein